MSAFQWSVLSHDLARFRQNVWEKKGGNVFGEKYPTTPACTVRAGWCGSKFFPMFKVVSRNASSATWNRISCKLINKDL